MKLQQLAEEKIGVLIVFTLLVVSVGLLIEVVPFTYQGGNTAYAGREALQCPAGCRTRYLHP